MQKHKNTLSAKFTFSILRSLEPVIWKGKGDFSEISTETEGFFEQEAGGQFEFRCVSRRTYFMSDRTHTLTTVCLKHAYTHLLIKVLVFEFCSCETDWHSYDSTCNM